METCTRRSRLLWIATLCLALAGTGCSNSSSAEGDSDESSDSGDGTDGTGGDDGTCANDEGDQQTGSVTIDEATIVARVADPGLSISLELTPRDASATVGTLQLVLSSATGSEVAASVAYDVSAGPQTLEVPLSGSFTATEPGQLAGYVLTYNATDDDGLATRGQVSLFAITDLAQVVLHGPTSLTPDATSHYRVYAQDPQSHLPVVGAAVTATLSFGEAPDDQTQTVFEGLTDAAGLALVTFDLPQAAATASEATLTVLVDDGSLVQESSATVAIDVPRSLLLTTDKPLYQPGQTMHLRLLALSQPGLDPLAASPATIEVLDGKGNKVFKELATTSAWGVVGTEFRLAGEVNLGTYTVRATVGDAVVEKAVTVDRYSLPKYGITVETDRAFYQPGQTLSGTLAANYFFGKPVAGGTVRVEARKWDVEFVTFAELSGTTDPNGVFAFSLPLPSYFVGQPLDDGGAFVTLAFEVTDTAGQTRTVERSYPVVSSSILPQIIPESGVLVPGTENLVYILTTDPTGQPVAAESDVVVSGAAAIPVTANDAGVATVNLTPASSDPIEIAVASHDDSGNTGSRTASFTPGEGNAFVLLRTDRALYRVGEMVQVTVRCPAIAEAAGAFQDRIYLDVIKDGRTALMTTVPVTAGQGTAELTITPDLVGGFQIEAYYLDQSSQIVRDRKLVYADPADALSIAVSTDQSIYAPADEAAISFTVTDEAGSPVSAALGVQIVDEAVFGLMEFRPGLEKIFYGIEGELAAPRYEVHGYDLGDVTQGDPEDGEARDAAAELLFAAAGDTAFGLFQDSYAGVADQARVSAEALFAADVERLRTKLAAACLSGVIDTPEQMRAWITANQHCWADPWGQRYAFTLFDDHGCGLRSTGPDEVAATGDDLAGYVSVPCLAPEPGTDDDTDDWGGDADADGDADMDTDGDADWDTDSAWDTDDSGGGAGIKVRKNFPETLYVNPEIITDAAGRATISVPLADSITTWRLSALASAPGGRLGSTDAGITVFQDFFVDLDLPAVLTQNDEIEIPVAVYNYLDEAQTVTLSLDIGDGFELLDTADKAVAVAAGAVAGASFRVRARDVGLRTLTVFGSGTTLADAVARNVEIRPDGKEIVTSYGGRLDGAVEHQLDIPAEAIAGGSKILVKVYPGLFAQAVEGLDSILQLPDGCFEQTSSTTYPNVLVLDYLMQSGLSTPEVELKAREYISLGYQKLLTFESPGGGFEWFGGTPAHNILTAYGLLEFSDMARVHPVDEAVITRTQDWLAAQQQADGHFEPSSNGIAEGAINAYETDVARTTAYLTYALIESGYDGAAVTAGLSWLEAHRAEVTDAYGLGMIAAAFVADDPNAARTQAVLDELHDLAVTSGDETHWTGSGESTTYGTGNVIDIEATALVAISMLRASVYPDDVTNAINWLLKSKDSLGNWETTQATILTLRLLIESLQGSSVPGAATVRVYAHDTLVETLEITAATSDVLRLVDLGAVTAVGANPVRLEIDGDSSLAYQIVGRHYLPWTDPAGEPSVGTLDIDVQYDTTELAVDDIVQVAVTVTNTVPSSVAKMVLIDLGLPPGFELVDDDLVALVEAGTLRRFEKTPRQLILYVDGISDTAPLLVTYALRASYPVVASTGSAEAHPYYTPDDSTEVAPTELTVTP